MTLTILRRYNLQNNKYGLSLVALSFILTVWFAFSKATGILTQQYYDIFLPVILIANVILVLILILKTRKRGLDQPFFFSEDRPQTPFSNIVAKVGLFLVLTFIFSAGAVQLGAPIIDLPQPFTQQSFSQVTDFDKIFYQSMIPGFYEEFLSFVVASSLSFIIILLFGKTYRYMAYLFGSGVSAAILTQAHRIAYGSDQAAYIGVFIFEFFMQFANLVTGLFLSWIPHMAHNAVVSLNFLVAFSVGGVALSSLYMLGKVRRIRT